MRDHTCSSCRNFIPFQTYEESFRPRFFAASPNGECHAGPPALTANRFARPWPTVAATDRCAHHSAERKEPAR